MTKIFVKVSASVCTLGVCAAVFVGCSSPSEPTDGGAVGANALGANASAYVTQIRSFATTEGHVPQTQEELLKATGGQKLPDAQLKVTYFYNPANSAAFCLVSTSVNTTSVYDSVAGGNQPESVKTCSAGFVPAPSASSGGASDPIGNPGSLLSR